MSVAEFDNGPDPSWAQLFGSAAAGLYTNHPELFRVGFGPVWYRGRLAGAVKVLVVGQDPSTDEVLAQRILVGSAGQRVQGLLRKVGITSSYAMFNTFLYGIQKLQDNAPLKAWAEGPLSVSFRNKVFDKIASANSLEAIVSFGNFADRAVQLWAGRPVSVPWFQLHHPSATEADVLSDWNANLSALIAAVTPDNVALVDSSPYGASFDQFDVADIPRADLPFGIPHWHGTGGKTHSDRSGPNQINWKAPDLNWKV